MKKQNQPSYTIAVILAAVAVLCALNVQPAIAGTRTWNGGATPDGNWTNPGNWNGTAPTTNDLLVFSGTTQTATTNNFSAATPFNNITFATGAGAFTVDGNQMELSEPTDAGSGQIANGSINNSSANNEAFHNQLLILDGNHRITSTGAGVLGLNGSITRSNGAVVSMSGKINVTGGLSTNGAANGILGGWAIYSNNWATLDANSNIVTYSGYTDVAAAGTIASNPASNVRIPSAGANISITAPVTAINSLLLSAGNAAQTVAIGATSKLVLGQNGGIYNSSPIASGGTYRNLTIGSSVGAGGVLTAGDGIHPATITLGSPPLASGSTGFITINSSIQDNNGAPVTLVIAGAYASLNGGGPATGAYQTNTYSGGTYILQGRFSQANPFLVGSGPIHIYPGGQVNCGWPITNFFDIEGTGTTENNGMGALRLYAANPPNTNGNLPGTIFLRGNAAVCADNDITLTHVLGFSGKITGPGNLSFGSPTATSRSGILNIGSITGTSTIPNDYAGDTIINGIAGGTISTTVRICNTADNNIMPHGATGSFTGGPTGNLVFNATANNRQAILDLNGSTQTINGLSSVSGVANNINNLVTDNGPGNGTLIVGDNNASSTFLGVVQNGVSLTKIGSGAITIGGPNNYNGATIVKAGRLITTTASTGAGAFSVSNSAALGVTVASLGTTLPISSLTLDSGSSLQLNAGSFGNPTAAIVNVSGALTLNGPVNISLSGIGLTAGGPFTIMTYAPGSRSGGGSFNLVTSPRIVATLNDDTINGIVSITITSADSGIKWKGGASGNWDINDNPNTIWQTVPSGVPAFYIESGSGNDSVIFDDSATGTTMVNLTTTLTPQSLAVTNALDTYTFAGSGKITGGAGLMKAGTNALIIANAGNNDFSGNITLAAGTLVISNNWSLPNSISGGGALVKSGSGSLSLSGDNSALTGPVTINGGTMTVLTSSSLTTNVPSTTVTNGGTLDIGNNNVALGQEPLIVSGAGVGGNGAIVNSSGFSGGAVATSFQNLTLADNTTIGGPGRLDFCADDINNGNNATLSTGGHAFKLTKTSINTLRFAGVQIDNSLGDIDLQNGTLQIHGNMTSLGNSANTLTVFGGAILQFDALTGATPINKNVVVNDTGVINNNSGDNIFAGAISLQGNSLFNVTANSLTLNGAVGGSGALNKVTGAGLLVLGTANSYNGTVASAGLISFSADNNLGALPGSPTPGNIVLNGGGIASSTDVTVSANRGIAVGPPSGAGGGFIGTSSTLTYNGIIANNGAGTGTLIVTNGGTIFLGGTNTYTGNTIVAQGTLSLTGHGSISASSIIDLLGMTLDASGRVDGTLTLAPGQTLTGFGNITGNLTNGPGSTFSPGTNLIAFYSVSGSVAFRGTNVMNINNDISQNDEISAGGTISYGGTLVLVISNAVSPLTNGEAFQLYSAPNYNGAFANIIPPTPGAGLAWDTNTLTTDGMLRITIGATLPTTNANITKVTLSGTNVLVHGTNNNVPNTNFHYAVLTSTNITLPLSNWTPVVTNPFNFDGTFDYTNPIVPGTPRQFIEVEAVP